MKRKIVIRARYDNQQRQLVQEAVIAITKTRGVVISHARTVKEVQATKNYNYSIELPANGSKRVIAKKA